MKQNHDKLITDLALMAGGYFLVLRPIFQKVGLEKDTQVIATEKKPTKPEAEWKIIADQIYADLRHSAISDDKADAGYQVSRLQNDADMALLIKWFAKRREYLFGVNGDLMDLQQFIRSNLSNSAIAKINDNYSRKGIKYRF